MTSFWIVPLAAVALAQVAVLATSMYLHRALAHRSVVVHPAANLLFRAVLWLTTGQDRREWVAVHRFRRFASDIREDRLDRAVFSRGSIGLALGATLLCLVLGLWQGLIAGSVHAVLYVFVLAPLINGLGHWRGAQNFSNTAYNSPVLAWVTAGESLHNNHHAYPRLPKFSVRWFEFDPSWLVIRALATVGLLVITGTPATPAGSGAPSGEP